MTRSGHPFRRVVLLAGGVGGAKMAEGLALALPPNALTVVGNVGDDESFYGLHVSPDIDTLIYTLSNRIDRKRGWGVANDATTALSVLADLGAPSWMTLGDKDFGLHIWRSWRLGQGASLTEVTDEAGGRLAARARVLPVTNDRVRTRLQTPAGWMEFQTWFVREKCVPRVMSIRYEGAEQARVTPEVVEAIKAADAIVFAPSNPLLSIAPMLSIPGLRELLQSAQCPRVAVSPLIAGQPVKGPLGRLLLDNALPADTRLIANAYKGLIDGVAIDTTDALSDGAFLQGLHVLATDILMPTPLAAEAMASRLLAWLPEVAADKRMGSAS